MYRPRRHCMVTPRFLAVHEWQEAPPIGVGFVITRAETPVNGYSGSRRKPTASWDEADTGEPHTLFLHAVIRSSHVKRVRVFGQTCDVLLRGPCSRSRWPRAGCDYSHTTADQQHTLSPRVTPLWRVHTGSQADEPAVWTLVSATLTVTLTLTLSVSVSQRAGNSERIPNPPHPPLRGPKLPQQIRTVTAAVVGWITGGGIPRL